MKETKDFRFDKRASSYDEGFEGKLSSKFYKLLLRKIDIKQGESILDVGCGTGMVLSKIDESCSVEGYGIDIEENMIKEANRRCPKMNIFISSCSQTPFENNKFDIITTCMAYHHFADKNGFAKEASRVIKTGGYLYITDPNFPWVIRKPLNLALRIHKIAGHFGTAKEIGLFFEQYGFELIETEVDAYAQCIKLKKVS